MDVYVPRCSRPAGHSSGCYLDLTAVGLKGNEAAAETVIAGTDVAALANLHLMPGSGHVNFRNLTYVP